MRSAIVVVIGIGFGLFAGCYRDAAPAGGAAGAETAAGSRRRAAARDALGFMPRAATFVVHVDVARLRDSAAWPRIEPRVRARMELARTTCGIDPVATLGSVTVGMLAGDAKPAGVGVARGIDAPAVLACVRELLKGSPQLSSTATGVVVREVAPGVSLAIEMLDPTTLVAQIGPGASAATLATVLDAGVPLRGSAGFSELYAALPRRSPVWLVANADAPGLAVASAALGMSPRAVFGGLELSAGLAVELHVRLADAATATAVADRSAGQLAIARGFFDQLEVTGEASDVVLRARMTADQLETAAALLGGF